MSKMKTLVRGAYDMQKMRIQMGNRIAMNFRVHGGQAPGETDEDVDAVSKSLILQMKRDYRRITDGIVGLPSHKKFKAEGVISDYTDLVLVDQYLALLDREETAFKQLKQVLKGYPIYTVFLEGVRGVGPAMAGVIISEIDITRAEYPSSLWKYAGLDVCHDGAGRSRRKEHLVDSEYTNKEGETATKKGITFNPFLKTKLVGVLGSSFIKQPAEHCVYRATYDDYKHRLQNHPAHQEKSKGHRHNMAVRYMVKRFLVDLYAAWRPLEGLPAAPDYSEAKLQKFHRKAA